MNEPAVPVSGRARDHRARRRGQKKDVDRTAVARQPGRTSVDSGASSRNSTPAPQEAREVEHEETEDRSPWMGDLAMASTISPEALKGLLESRSPFALIDVREAGEYNSSHIPGA